jgi:hypothetical protein
MVNLITHAPTSTSFYTCSVTGAHNHKLFGAPHKTGVRLSAITLQRSIGVTTQQQKDKFVLRSCIIIPYLQIILAHLHSSFFIERHDDFCEISIYTIFLLLPIKEIAYWFFLFNTPQ